MNFNPNLKFDEIIVRYGIMIVLGIIGGMLHNYWFVMPVMAIFLTAILGWCPVKAYFTAKREKTSSKDNTFLQHLRTN